MTYKVLICPYCGQRLYPFLAKATYNCTTNDEEEFEVRYPTCYCRSYVSGGDKTSAE